MADPSAPSNTIPIHSAAPIGTSSSADIGPPPMSSTTGHSTAHQGSFADIGPPPMSSGTGQSTAQHGSSVDIGPPPMSTGAAKQGTSADVGPPPMSSSAGGSTAHQGTSADIGPPPMSGGKASAASHDTSAEIGPPPMSSGATSSGSKGPSADIGPPPMCVGTATGGQQGTSADIGPPPMSGEAASSASQGAFGASADIGPPPMSASRETAPSQTGISADLGPPPIPTATAAGTSPGAGSTAAAAAPIGSGPTSTAPQLMSQVGNISGTGTSGLPKKYKAAIYDAPGTISTKIVDLDMPEPGPGEVLVNLTASGVCHSDLGIMTNTWKALTNPTLPGQVGGHEGVGKIVKLGPGADAQGIKIGDRVGIKWVASACGRCGPCLAGHDAVCDNVKVSGYYTPGTFQQYVVSAAHYVTPIPDALSDIEAASHLCAGITVYSALKKSTAHSGDTVVIMGAGGGLGHIACQVASKGFGYRVVGIDSDAKKQIILDSGAEHFVGLGSREAPNDTVAEVLKVTNGLGAKAVLVTAAANPAYASAVPMLKFGGRVVCIGIPAGDLVPIATAFPQLLIGKELSIIGSSVGTRKDAIEILDFAARGKVKIHYAEERMENLTKVFEQMHEGVLQGRVVLNLQ